MLEVTSLLELSTDLSSVFVEVHSVISINRTNAGSLTSSALLRGLSLASEVLPLETRGYYDDVASLVKDAVVSVIGVFARNSQVSRLFIIGFLKTYCLSPSRSTIVRDTSKPQESRPTFNRVSG